MQSDYDNSLQSYYTDMEHPRDMFKNFVSAEILPKRLIVYHGVGGVGKSSLLRMFRMHCKSEHVPAALASGDDAKSVLDVVTRWMEDLKDDGIKFTALRKTLESYRAIQAKVEDQAKKSENKAVDIVSQAASKTAAAGGAFVGGMIGSAVPIIGTAIGSAVGGAVSGMGAEALTDWLHGFLTKSDIDLLLDPAKKLSADFLEDISKTAEKQRIVLLLDTFEQMTALEDWAGEMVQKIHPNVLIVIAGRKLPAWNRVWSSWMIGAQVEELRPMTEEIMRELIHRYYSTMLGGEPDSAQVEAIIKFARGLPMVVTSAVQLWVKYGVEDFQSVRAEIVANLVDRLMEGVPSTLIPALEAAAVVRWMDQPILRAVMNKEDVRDVYNEIRRFPFVRSRVEGLALHDAVREMMDENLRVQDSKRHSELHQRAALYFEKQLEETTGEETEKLGLERLYQRFCSDEIKGLDLFQKMAEDLTRYRLVARLSFLLNDVNTYLLKRKDSILWREYYNARVLQLQALSIATVEKAYESICRDDQASPKLRAYVMCAWGQLLVHYEKLARPGGAEKAIDVLERSLRMAPLDSYLAQNYFHLERVRGYQGKRDDVGSQIPNAIKYYEQVSDEYGLSKAYVELKRKYVRAGRWKDLFQIQQKLMDISIHLPESSSLKERTFGDSNWGYALSGRLTEGQDNIKASIEIIRSMSDSISLLNITRDLGLILGLQGKYHEAQSSLEESLSIAKSRGEDGKTMFASVLGFFGAILVRQGDFTEAEKKLTESIDIKEGLADHGIVEPLVWQAQLDEIQQNFEHAQKNYERCLNPLWGGIFYFRSEALTGLVRVKHAQGDMAAIPPLLAEAEQLAQQYEYNDHLASLRLTQGHLAWENGNKDEALALYKQAMIYALRYNRFLLDELISERLQGSPLRPIIPYYLECSEEGRKIMFALRDWWKTGVNAMSTPRPDSISPIPEGIPLLDAEKLGRERELGAGSIQRSVMEQFEGAING